MSLEDQPRSPLQLSLTSIQERAFSEVFLRASGVHILLADNLDIWQQNQQCRASFYSTKSVALGHGTSWLHPDVSNTLNYEPLSE